ncbi:SDR family oxidoreductase [Candidatus Saccharibacteria bacterium]|nr:SDR family oxidoreductase [Candidatus Saccharibacteria bacterium]
MIVITGASDGLGTAFALTFAQSGRTVKNFSRSENPDTTNVTKLTPIEAEDGFRVNVSRPMIRASRLVQRIRQDNGGISSNAGTKAYQQQAACGASRWAIRGFSQNVQIECQGPSVRVICVYVSGFLSGLTAKIGKATMYPENWMRPKDITVCLRQLLEPPRKMDVNGTIINRKICL